MIQVAKARSRSHSNIEYHVANATRWAFPVTAFDCVVCIATLHHLPLEETLLKMRGTLKAGGTLAVLDLYQPAGLRDALPSLVAVPVSLALRLIHSSRLREPRRVREAWEEHGRKDSYPTLARVRRICERVLPGARVKRHLLWRYSIIWRKSDGLG
jgi:ubiquinone/menaquinone biosynthesis C-methylase UbiE